MSHFHLYVGPQGGPVISQVRYEIYEDSLVDLVELSHTLFAHLDEAAKDLTFEKAAEATEYGEGKGVYVGTQGYCIFWLPCEHCHSPQLN